MSRVVALISGEAQGEVLRLDEPLSFWGGVDPESGKIIEKTHPQYGESLTGRILAMPHGRGSSSASSVLAETLRQGHGPAAIVLEEPDSILLVGALVAADLYEVACPVVTSPTLPATGEVWSLSGDEMTRMQPDRARGPMEKSALLADKDNTMMGASEVSDLFSRTPVALYRTDVSGNLMTANDALATLLGYESIEDAAEAIDSVYSVYVDPEDRDRWIAEIEREGLVTDFDIELRRADGSTIWVSDTARAIEDDSGQIVYYEGALIDVTEKVEAKRARDEFLATVSHELRNPIAVVLGLGQELANRYDSFSNEDRRDMAQMIASQAEDASWLIEDLLVAYRDDIGDVAVAPQRFELVESIKRVLEVIDHDIALEVGKGETTVRADPRRTRQIIRNLANNALHYGGEEIIVRVRRTDANLEVSVCDSGDPLDPEEVDDIFQAFKRGSRSSHPTSVGLGLPVARRLARLMGGDLSYTHEDGYSCFVLTLPAA